VDEGLVPIAEPVTAVRIFNTNTRKIMVAEVPVSGGRAKIAGDHVVDGVPGTGAKIVMNFLNSAGSRTGKLLPTGNVIDEIELSDGRRVRCSLVDAANPAVFVQAADIGCQGTELPDDCAAEPRILRALEEIRLKAALLMELAADPQSVSPAVPKVAMVSAARAYRTIAGTDIGSSDCDLVARTKALAVMHKAFAVTGGICLSAAALIDGTVVNAVVSVRARETGVVRVGHPTGVSSFMVNVISNGAGFELTRSAVAGTARRIMDGYVYVPYSVFRASGKKDARIGY
jgi:2-methylaconitate cis-trans-isomerase PrpF